MLSANYRDSVFVASRRLLCFHEASHCVMAVGARIRVETCSVKPGKGYDGVVRHHNPLYRISRMQCLCNPTDQARIRSEKNAMIALAGAIGERLAGRNPRAAELCLADWPALAGHDLKQAVDALSYFARRGRYSRSSNGLKRYLEHSYARAFRYLSQPVVWRVVQSLASVLAVNDTLDALTIRKFCRALPPALIPL